MSEQYSFAEPGCVRRELTRILLERVQGAMLGRFGKGKLREPEKKSPKAVYEVEDILNNAYMNRDEVPLAMDIFKPVTDEDRELPVIVVIHGGGLVLGDRTMARTYSRTLASRGYLVFSIEYRLAPRANACEQLDDVCAGMDLIGRRLVDFNVDFTRVFLTAESAGAYLAIYVAAMKQSEKLQKAIGYEPTRMVFKALGLHSGMFYTERNDPIGWLLADQFYGDKIADENFFQYLDPEHEEILRNLPPVFLTTSRGDFLNQYTLMYHDALKKAGRRSHLMYFGDEDLGHAFAASECHKAASIDAIDRMIDWFEEQAEQYKVDQKRHAEEAEALEKIDKRVADGTITGQKSWQFMKELNSYSKERLDSVAIIDCKREYTYRQMFRMWDSYAEVFSALGITGKNGSRAGMSGTPSAESAASLFALNMTGASVSMLFEMEAGGFRSLKNVIEKEGITDLILDDVATPPALLRKIMDAKEELGIRNVIVLHQPVRGELISEQKKRRRRKNYKDLKQIEGVLFMNELLKKYEAYPIEYSTDTDEAALILHTSGTTDGIPKPVPMSDEGLNESTARMLRDGRFKDLRGNAVTCLSGRMVMSYELIDCLLLPLTFGGKVVILPLDVFGPGIIKAFPKYGVNVLFASGFIMSVLENVPFRLDLSSVEHVFLGGTYVSDTTRKKFNKVLKKFGSKAKVTIGYGLTEAGAACIVSSPDRNDNAMGYPLPGVKVKIYDEKEKKYFDIEDGPRTGVMFISSASVSSGRIGDRVFFELEDIDGEKYLNTFDCVRVNEDGSLTYAGRMNRYFVNNEGIRFDAGLVETSVSAEPGIEECALAPVYSKWLHDTVPVLYVETEKKGTAAEKTVRRVLKKVFIEDGRIRESNMPAQLVLAGELPHNASGKVDVSRLRVGETKGRRFVVQPIRMRGKLKDIELMRISDAEADVIAGVPEEAEKLKRQAPPKEDFGGMGCDMFQCPDAEETDAEDVPDGLPDEIIRRIESGEIIEQKCWQFIKELNSYSEESLDAVALADGRREYTYRQMFRKWERYAEVFSALEMTGENHTRVLMRGTTSTEIISALFALNMTGASVSLVRYQTDDISILKDITERENITDLILPDCGLSAKRIRKIRDAKEELGLRNIIVIHIPMLGETKAWWEERESVRRYKEMKKVSGVMFFDDLLKEFKGTKICFAEESADDALIIHTSGTTTGKRKSVPFSDRGINEASRRLLADPQFAELRGRAESCLFLEISVAYSMFDMLCLPLAFGGKVTALPEIKEEPEMLQILLSRKPNILFTLPPVLNAMMAMPFRPDLSFIRLVFSGGGYVSPEAKKRFDRYLKRCGAKTGLTIGYGNSEAGGAVIVSKPERKDDAIGFPLLGMKIRLYDEESKKYIDPADGPCRGVLHICSPSVSTGSLDGNVLFELTDIDGEKYLNTYDLVEVREDGAYYFVGRMNKFFINNEGIRFDSGLVERALTERPEIESCGIAPRFSRYVRDTVPSLYVKTREDSDDPKAAVRKALKKVYIDKDMVSGSYLPFDVTVTDEMPYNDGGKVDIYRITTGKVKGRHYGIVPVRENGVLKDIRLETFNWGSDAKAMTDEMKKHDDVTHR